MTGWEKRELTDLTPFHLAFAVDDLASADGFYVDVLGCERGRSDNRWIDFSLFGHQITAHLIPGRKDTGSNPVDGDQVPIPHYGVILEWAQWETLAQKVRISSHPFLIEPRIRFEGLPGEQGTFFVRDPAGNALEFKGFRNFEGIFST